MSGNLAVAGEQNEQKNEVTLQEEVRPVLETLKELKVVDGQSFERAAESYGNLTALEKKVGEYWDGPIDAAHKVHKDLVAKRKAMLEPLAAAKVNLRGKMKAWQAEEDRKRAELERKAAEAARNAAEDEKLARATELEAQGRKDEATAALEAPTPAPTVIVQSNVPAGYGNITRKTWKFQVTDLQALVKAIAEGKAPLKAILPNDVFLGNQARTLKAELIYPGVKVWEE
jgi:hypothetical protein